MNKYLREIKLGTQIDVYDVLVAYDVTCPAIQHAIKKLLMPGMRGSKGASKDLIEAYDSIARAVTLLDERRHKETKCQVANANHVVMVDAVD